jgi:hypothetical protein
MDKIMSYSRRGKISYYRPRGRDRQKMMKRRNRRKRKWMLNTKMTKYNKGMHRL